MAELTFKQLRDKNVPRMAGWHEGAEQWSGADWSNAMCGEAGEAANEIKKLRRIETGIGGMSIESESKQYEDRIEALRLELADVVTYADLVAHHYGIDLGRAVADKFNMVSEKRGLPERLGV